MSSDYLDKHYAHNIRADQKGKESEPVTLKDAWPGASSSSSSGGYSSRKEIPLHQRPYSIFRRD